MTPFDVKLGVIRESSRHGQTSLIGLSLRSPRLGGLFLRGTRDDDFLWFAGPGMLGSEG